MFCYYQLKADLTKLVNVSAGTAQKNLLIGDLKNYFISFPESLPEQHAIVAKLDAISLETKKLEAIYQKKLVDLDEMKKSILQKAFNGELTN
jgi:type I restriction enzyme S subunit